MTKNSLEKRHIKVLLLEGVHASAAESFRADGYDSVEEVPGALAEDALVEKLRDVHIVGIRSRTQLTARVLGEAKRLITVGAFCIGTNQVDVGAARERGIPVFNAPFSNTRSVAELVLAEVVMLLRGIPARNAATHRGEWLKTASGSHEARGKTLGIVGYGHIGTQVGVLAEALGMRVVFYDIETKLALGNAEPVASLDALLARADVVTLHVPETPATQGMIGPEQIAKMKRGTSLINASRGTVVDIEALARALTEKHLAGAAIDVYPAEPESGTEPFVSPLRRFDNVLLTPHIGGSTVEAQHQIGLEVATKLLKYSNNGSTVAAVNFPEVSLPAQRGRQRFLHIHHNVPGVLSQIDAVFSRSRVNIASQYLQTDPFIGYVVIDIDADEKTDSQALREQLAAIEGTVKTRLLH
ncbi:MAG TPA: phosphoglycerate dehydrogenase [Myxococcales bacterium]|jgi:D-3-phosphoglycerate dehydrogenase